MAILQGVEAQDGTTVVDSAGKVNYGAIEGIPSEMVDTSTHNHDDMYTSNVAIEDKFTFIMNKVAAITKALTIRPLKTKGFLNGGYKSSYVYAERVQRFNTVTETGVEIGQIGTVTSQYSPGGSSELKGYYFGDVRNGATSNFNSTGREVDKITYLTEVEVYLGNITLHNTESTLYNVYSQSKIYLCDNSTNWSKVTVVTDTIDTVPSAALGRGIGRQGLSSEDFGYVLLNGSSTTLTSTKFTYLTGVGETGTTQVVRQQPAGLTKDKDLGYWVDYGTAHNWRVNMLANTVSNVVCFTQGFGESNTLGSEKVGFCMGGYDGVQHGYVQKMVWATEAASNVLGGSLAIPQSSAGMAES